MAGTNPLISLQHYINALGQLYNVGQVKPTPAINWLPAMASQAAPLAADLEDGVFEIPQWGLPTRKVQLGANCDI